jgi:hypothetical protein
MRAEHSCLVDLEPPLEPPLESLLECVGVKMKGLVKGLGKELVQRRERAPQALEAL